MGVDGEQAGQSVLTEVDREAAAHAPFRPGRRSASDFGNASAAALQRRIGAPRGSAPQVAAPETAAATELAERRRRSRPPRRPAPPAASPATEIVVDRPSRVRNPQQHEFGGTVSVSVGPFDDLDPIGEFAEALSSIDGVASVRIRTFDRASVVFDVDLAEPTALIARLRGRSPHLLRLLYANDRIIRLKIV